MTGLIPARNFSLVDGFFNDDLWPVTARPRAASFIPSFDVAEDDESYFITADLPGIKVADIDISYHRDMLTISGARKIENGKRMTQRERVSGSFSRTFGVPKGTITDDISASSEDGVLTVKIPKAPEAKPKQIPINVR